MIPTRLLDAMPDFVSDDEPSEVRLRSRVGRPRKVTAKQPANHPTRGMRFGSQAFVWPKAENEKRDEIQAWEGNPDALPKRPPGRQ
jgi:hypothetical protein